MGQSITRLVVHNEVFDSPKSYKTYFTSYERTKLLTQIHKFETVKNLSTLAHSFYIQVKQSVTSQEQNVFACYLQMSHICSSLSVHNI